MFDLTLQYLSEKEYRHRAFLSWLPKFHTRVIDLEKRTPLILKESKRVEGKVVCKIVKYFWIAHNDKELKHLKKIAQKERITEGLHSIIKNDFEEDAKELLSQYKRLWFIEESFGINKHSLSMRPIYHYKPKRIIIYYLTFSLYRSLQMKLNINNISMSSERIIEKLSHIRSSILEHQTTGKMYKLLSPISKEIKSIYKMLNLPF